MTNNTNDIVARMRQWSSVNKSLADPSRKVFAREQMAMVTDELCDAYERLQAENEQTKTRLAETLTRLKELDTRLSETIKQYQEEK